MMSKIGNEKAGFTLIEVMVATAVLSLSALLVFEAFFISLDTYNYCGNSLNVVSLADEKIWQAQDDLTHFGALIHIGGRDEFVNRSKKFLWDLTYGTIDSSLTQDLYKINLNLSWQEGKRAAKISRTAFAIYGKK